MRKLNILLSVFLVLNIFLCNLKTAEAADVISANSFNTRLSTSVSQGNRAIVGSLKNEHYYYVIDRVRNTTTDICVSAIFNIAHPYLNGKATIELRKNNINGPLIYSNTRTFNNYYVGTSPYNVGFDIPEYNPDLSYGETLYIVLDNQTDRPFSTTTYYHSWRVEYRAVDVYSVDTNNNIQNAVDAANSANTAAQGAKTSADTAAARSLNNYNILNDSTKGLSKTFDAANSANTNAANAKSSADAARTESVNAKNAANDAKTFSYYNGTYGGPSESVGDIAGYIRIPQCHSPSTIVYFC